MTPLHYLGEFLREAMAAVPLPFVRALFVAMPLAVLVWVITLPSANAVPDGGTTYWFENLKIWAVLALFIQVLIYAWL